jgi:hypothetical protein
VGIDAINLAASKILSRLADVVVEGGFESHNIDGPGMTKYPPGPM